MIDPDALHVWYGQTLVGYLWRDATGRIGYRYDQDWLHKDGFAISVSLPLSAEDYRSEAAIAHHYFANLLPEGNAREQIVIDLKIANTDFDLLRAIGGECAGALMVLPDDREPMGETSYEELSDDEFPGLIQRRGNIYSRTQSDSVQAEHPRLSLAGAQNKCPVFMQNNLVYLPRGEAPSTHILKFTIPDYRHVPAYEAILTELAKRIGLNTVDVEFKRLHVGDQEHHYLVVTRYDRQLDEDGSIRRVHQEDFCQALGVSHARKYEQDGGVDFKECYQLLQRVSVEPTQDILQLLKWQIFNYLAGNSDGHTKNLSLLYDQDSNIRLAPFYDLVCTRAIDRIDKRLAFAVGGQRLPGEIHRQQWENEAEEVGIRKAFVLSLLRETAEAVSLSIKGVVDEFQQQYGEYAALQRLVQVVERQCGRVLREVGGR